MITKILIVSLLILLQPVFGISDKQHEKRFKALAAKTLALFKAEEWDTLESLITEARDQRLKMERGNYLLDRYFRGLMTVELANTVAPVEEWEAWFAKIDRWSDKHPNSLVTPSLKLTYWLSFARIERLRNRGKIDEDEIALRSRERLRVAQDIYHQSLTDHGGVFPCPQFYKNGIYLALAQKWDREETYASIITPLIEHFPWYHPALWLGKAQYSKTPAENEPSQIDYFHRVALDLPKDLGSRFYTIAILNWDLYTRTDALWESFDLELFKRGIPHYMRNIPNDAHHIARALAFLSEYDSLTSHVQIFRDLKVEFPQKMKKEIKRNKYFRILDYSLKHPSDRLEAMHHMRPVNVSVREYIRGMVTLGTEHLVATYKDSLLLYNHRNKVIISQRKSEGYQTGKMASSEDGRYLVVEWKDRTDLENKVRIVLYRFEDDQFTEIASTHHAFGKSRVLEITPDFKKIFISTYHQVEKKDHLLMWEWERNLPVQTIHSANICKHWGSMCFHRPSESLYFYDNVVKKCSYTKEQISVEPAKAFQGIKGLIYDFKSFGNETHAALLVREKGKPSRLHISNLETDTHLGSVDLPIPGRHSYEYRLEILATSDPNIWNMITIGSQWGVALWSIDLRDLNKAKLVSYKVTNGKSFFSSATAKSPDRAPTLFTADARANIYQWAVRE